MKDSTIDFIIDTIMILTISLCLGLFFGYITGSISLHDEQIKSLEEKNETNFQMVVTESIYSDRQFKKLKEKDNRLEALIQQLQLEVLDHRKELKEAKDYIDNNHLENAKLFDDIFKHLFILEQKREPKTVINKYYYMPYKKHYNKGKRNGCRRSI